VNVGVRLLPEEQLVNSLAAIGCSTNEDYKNYALHTLFGNGETQAQFAGMFTELVHFLLYSNARYLIINQTTRVSNGTMKMALLHKICELRGTTKVVASQYDVPPMSTAESDHSTTLTIEKEYL
jgi:hypothetical protein